MLALVKSESIASATAFLKTALRHELVTRAYGGIVVPRSITADRSTALVGAIKAAAPGAMLAQCWPHLTRGLFKRQYASLDAKTAFRDLVNMIYYSKTPAQWEHIVPLVRIDVLFSSRLASPIVSSPSSARGFGRKSASRQRRHMREAGAIGFDAHLARQYA